MHTDAGDRPPETQATAGVTPAEVLRCGELIVLGRIPHASNATLVCDAVLDGVEMRCVYKPVRGEVPLWDFPDGTLAGREVASAAISDALGWSVIPPTIHRDGPLGPGMVQQWIDDDELSAGAGTDLVDLCPIDRIPDGFRPIIEAIDASGASVALVHSDDPRLQRMAVLDVVLNNADRKGGHILVDANGVHGIDHGICLHAEDKLRTVLWGWAGEPVPDGLLTDLSRLRDRLADPGDPLRATLADHLTDEEIGALHTRVAVLVETGVMPYPSGHRPIPWPPF